MSIYVLTNPELKRAQKYRIGYTRDSQDILLERERKHLPEPEVLLFIADTEAQQIQQQILCENSLHRVTPASEWLRVYYPRIEDRIWHLRTTMEADIPNVQRCCSVI